MQSALSVLLDADATAYALHNYGDAREAAGYAAGVAAGGRDAEIYAALIDRAALYKEVK